MEKETVQGELQGAIEQYKKLAQSKDRSIAARALVRMADSLQKLGNADARKVYESILRDYPNEKDQVAVAIIRLKQLLPVGTGQAAAVSNRVVWTYPPGSNFFSGQVSADGRFLAFSRGSEIYLHDFTTGEDRQVTNTAKRGSDLNNPFRGDFEGYGGTGYFAFSRDSKQLAYSWQTDGHQELRVMSLQGTGFPRPRVVISNKDIQWLDAFDWTADDNIAAVTRWPFRRSTRSGSRDKEHHLAVDPSLGWRAPQTSSRHGIPCMVAGQSLRARAQDFGTVYPKQPAVLLVGSAGWARATAAGYRVCAQRR
jgi:hypothetical protein